ncbi:hypothetical protein [Desulfoluna sp.]|uniref:hypothetical protein n=1 Tax=Desulfoluna sp. TaxID=2045199 RepID=UPI002609450F|nr:hypothetical protein [Desulfoluna sp.]
MNEATSFIRKAYEFNKSGFENVYNAMGSFQAQAEEVTFRLFSENPIFPEPAQKIVKSGFDACKQGRDSLKGQVDKSQKAFEELLTAANL